MEAVLENTQGREPTWVQQAEQAFAQQQVPAQAVPERQAQQPQPQAQGQAQAQTQEPSQRTYENDDFIHVHDFQVSEKTNSETGERFYDVKLMKGTTIEIDGQQVDVSHYHFTTAYEPAVLHGEPGSPQCMRSIHFPDGWDLTLKRFENAAQEGQPPAFKEAHRIEGVTPKQIADGTEARDNAWRESHKKVQEIGSGAPDKAQSAIKKAHEEPSL